MNVIDTRLADIENIDQAIAQARDRQAIQELTNKKLQIADSFRKDNGWIIELCDRSRFLMR